MISERGTRVRVDEDLGRVRANATQVYRVFSNLLGNAIVHNDSKRPVLEVRLLDDEGHGRNRYLVRDNGSGMPGEQARRVPGLLINRKRRRRDPGIGLSIVENILKSCGGELRIYNDHGACFEVVLPDFAISGRPFAPRRDPASPRAMRTAA